MSMNHNHTIVMRSAQISSARSPSLDIDAQPGLNVSFGSSLPLKFPLTGLMPYPVTSLTRSPVLVTLMISSGLAGPEAIENWRGSIPGRSVKLPSEAFPVLLTPGLYWIASFSRFVARLARQSAGEDSSPRHLGH